MAQVRHNPGYPMRLKMTTILKLRWRMEGSNVWFCGSIFFFLGGGSNDVTTEKLLQTISMVAYGLWSQLTHFESLRSEGSGAVNHQMCPGG